MTFSYHEHVASEDLFRRLELVKVDDGYDFHGMMHHILECIFALKCTLIVEETPLDAAYIIVFKETVSFLSDFLSDTNIERDDRLDFILPTVTPSTDRMMKSSWYPLHWAVLLCDRIEEKIIRDIYHADPFAISQSYEMETDSFLRTPAHLLCASKTCTKQQHSLLNYLIIRNAKAFTVDTDGFGMLHVLAKCSNDINLLRQIIQLAPNEVSVRYDGDSPLDILIRERFSESDDCMEMVECLLRLDNSPEVVYYSITACFDHIKVHFSTHAKRSVLMLSRARNFIERMLSEYPAIVTYRDSIGRNLLSQLLSPWSDDFYFRADDLLFELFKLMISVDNQIVRQLSNDGRLPIHYAARHSLSALKLLLDEYPESATSITNNGYNLLHHAVLGPSEEVVTYLCSQYPEFIKMFSNDGMTPLHKYLVSQSGYFELEIVSSICKTDPDIVKLATRTYFNQLPLHLLIANNQGMEFDSNDELIFRLVLNTYPAAANIKDKRGRTPYDLAVAYSINPYFLRLLLYADKSINPQELYRLNYKERRMALFLSSGVAIFGSSNDFIIWRSLWLENKEILKKIVSYL